MGSSRSQWGSHPVLLKGGWGKNDNNGFLMPLPRPWFPFHVSQPRTTFFFFFVFSFPCFKLTLCSRLTEYQNNGQTVSSALVPETVSVPAVREPELWLHILGRPLCACVLSSRTLLHHQSSPSWGLLVAQAPCAVIPAPGAGQGRRYLSTASLP